jgi:hypothetical protein
LFYFLPDPSRSAAPICSPSVAAAPVRRPVPTEPSAASPPSDVARPFPIPRAPQARGGGGELLRREGSGAPPGRGRGPPRACGGELLRHERISHVQRPGRSSARATSGGAPHALGAALVGHSPRGGAPTATPPGGEIRLARLGWRAHVHRALVPRPDRCTLVRQASEVVPPSTVSWLHELWQPRPVHRPPDR